MRTLQENSEISHDLHFIMTGGTLDSYYCTIKDTAIPNEKTSVPKFVNTVKLYENCKFTELFMKDSRDINDEDREKILCAVKDSESKRVIIVHGTYTLPETAKYLKSNLKDNNKIIIFVCSMIPLEGFTPTDAGFNIGYATAMTQILKKGIYVCMNGRIFEPEKVSKIIEEGRFGSIYTK